MMMNSQTGQNDEILPIPYVHLAFVNASKLSPYALEPLTTATAAGQEGASAWQLCLDKLQQLPHRQLPRLPRQPGQPGQPGQTHKQTPSQALQRLNQEYLPCICLLPPPKVRLDAVVAEALNPQLLQRQGLYPIFLRDYSESALLQAVQRGIEVFYPEAFRPDPAVKALEQYLDHLDQLEAAGAPTAPNAEQTVQNKADKAFHEDIGLPLAMRFAPQQLDKQQVWRPENLTSRQIHCYWLEGDAPLLSPELARQLYDAHHRYAAELSFSDIYPGGLVPLLFQAAILGRLYFLSRKAAQVESGQSDILKIAERDLNLFAAEPLLADRDYRLLRLELRAASKRQFRTLQGLYRALPLPGDTRSRPDLKAVLDWLEGSTESLRSLPRYFPIQISRASSVPSDPAQERYGGPQKAQPESAQGLFMSRALWRELLAAIVEFAGDAVIGLAPLAASSPLAPLGTMGDPLSHPELPGMVEDLLQHPSLELLIETDGTQWQEAEIEHLKELDRQQRRITWIVCLDALEPSLYQELRAPEEELSADGMTASQQKAHALVDLLLRSGEDRKSPEQGSDPDTGTPRSSERVYVQAVRIKENEADLEAFYRYWSEGVAPVQGRTGTSQALAHSRPATRPQVIVQKYNSCAGLLPERQLLHLGPVKRFPCRRLAREMVFGIDAQNFFCVQDLQWQMVGPSHRKPGQSSGLGRFPDQSLAELWSRGQQLYRRHIAVDYPELCRDCDEYYVYNF